MKMIVSRTIFKCCLILSFLGGFGYNACASDYYWVNGSGNWSDFSHHWSTSSGGAIFHPSLPTPSDNVYFDENSFLTLGDTVFLDLSLATCNTMDWAGALNNPVFRGNSSYLMSNVLKVYGSLILNPTMRWIMNGVLYLNSSLTGNSINTNGLALMDSVSFTQIIVDGAGEWNLDNDIIASQIEIRNGYFHSNNYAITSNLTYFPISVSTSHVILGSSIINGDFYTNSYIDLDSTFINCNVLSTTAPLFFNSVISTSNVYSNSSSFKFLKCAGFSGDSNIVDEIILEENKYVNDASYYFCSIEGSNNIFQRAIVTDDNVSFSGKQVFDSLSFSNDGQKIQLTNDTLIVNDSFQFNGTCNRYSSISSSFIGSTIIFNTPDFSCDYVAVKNVKKDGLAVLTINNGIDEGGNTGWIINSAASRTLYWVGGGGSWSDSSHWALSSGGQGGACIPNLFDSVFFDASSFPTTGDTLIIDCKTAFCGNMNWANVTNVPVFDNSFYDTELHINGSFVLSPDMKYIGYGKIYLHSDYQGNSINTFLNFSNSIGSHFNLFIDGSGSWDLLSDFNNGRINLNEGFFSSNNFRLKEISISNTGSGTTAFLGTSIINDWYLSDSSNINLYLDSVTFDCISFTSLKTLQYHNVSAAAIYAQGCTFNNLTCYNFGGNNNTINEVVFGSNNPNNYVSVSGNNNYIHKALFTAPIIEFRGSNAPVTYSIDSLFFGMPGQSVNMTNGSIISINDYVDLSGSCNGTTTYNCSSGFATIHKSSGIVNANYVSLQGIHTSGGAAFVANNAIDEGGNAGWSLQSAIPRTLYWVGGTGEWNDVNHWSVSSGGNSGACLPNRHDDVFFDANSFLSANDSVKGIHENISIHTMDWSGITDTSILYLDGSSLFVYGSFTLNEKLKVTINGGLNFMSDSLGNTINTFGNQISSVSPWTTVLFLGSGSWDLLSDFNSDLIRLRNGVLKTNNFSISGDIKINDEFNQSTSASVYFGTSNISGGINIFGDSTLIHADSCLFNVYSFKSAGGANSYNWIKATNYVSCDNSKINYVESNRIYVNYCQFDKVRITDNFSISGNNCIFKKLVLPESGYLWGSNVFDSLILNNPGQNVEIIGSLIVNDFLNIQSDPLITTVLKCTSGSATITKLSDTVCTNNICINNIQVGGGAVFYAGANSTDLGGNSGWIWSSCNLQSDNVWPGDANADLISNNTDLLYIGLAYGYAGPVRVGASINWVGQPSTDWQYQFANGVNCKNADCDGSGIVDADDTTAIFLNYGQTHPLRATNPVFEFNSGANIYFDMPSGSLMPGTTVSIPIMLGTASYPVNNLYGIAFTVNYDPAFVQSGSMQIDFTSSWAASNVNSIQLAKDDYASGIFDVGLARTDHQNINGFGVLATLTFIVSGNVGGNLNFSITNITAIDKSEIPIPIQPSSASIYTSLTETPSLENLISVFPNPVSSMLNLKDPNNIIRQVELIDCNGKVVYRNDYLIGNDNINVTSLCEGLFCMRINTTLGVFVKKILIKS